MGMKFTQIPSDTFQKLQLNAGILVDSFIPATGTIGNLLGATSGGINFASNPTYSDFGEDVDNCPANMKELKRIDSYDPSMSGTFLTLSTAVVKKLMAAGDIDGTDTTKVVPRATLLSADFTDLWWIGDYSDVNTGNSAGFLAIHLMNALNTSGFQIQSGKNAKGQMSFEFHGHVSMSAQDIVPFEVYVKAGTGGSAEPFIMLDKNVMTIKVGESAILSPTVTPSGTTITWTSNTTAKATVSGGTVTGVATGYSIIEAAITVNSVKYTDTCTVIVEAAS